MRKRIATLALTCWTLPAWAQSQPAEIDPNRGIELHDLGYASNAIEGFLVVVIDHDNTLQGQSPSGEFGLIPPLETLEFRDDGQFPDGVAGDFKYVALSVIPETVQGRAQFRTMRADGTVIWDDVIPMPWEKALPWVALEIFADSPVKSTVMTNDFEDEYGGGPGQSTSEDGGSQSVGSNRSLDSQSRTTGTVGDGSDGEEGEGPPIAVLLAALLGVPILAWMVSLRRVRTRQLQPVGEPNTGNNAVQVESQIWVLADDRQRLDCIVQLARSRQSGGRVLVCPQANSRERLSAALTGISGVLWSQIDGPSVDQVWKSSQELRGWGRPLILVEGPNALESPDEGEASDIALKELVESDTGQMDVLILMTTAENSGTLSTRAVQPEDLVGLGLFDGDSLG